MKNSIPPVLIAIILMLNYSRANAQVKPVAFNLDSLIKKELAKFDYSSVFAVTNNVQENRIPGPVFRKKLQQLKSISFKPSSYSYQLIAAKDSFKHERWAIKGNNNREVIVDLYSLTGVFHQGKSGNRIKSEIIHIAGKNRPYQVEFTTSNIGELQALKIDRITYYIVYDDPIIGMDEAIYVLQQYMEKK